MKTRGIIILIVATALTGAAYLMIHTSSCPFASGPAPAELDAPARTAENENLEPLQDNQSEPLPRPTSKSVRAVATPPPGEDLPVVNKNSKPHPPTPRDPAQYWERQAKRFNKLLEQLALEENPDQRKRLIQSLAAYVRVDTLGTLDWAMGLEDPDEQRAALDAVNKYALSGIGARIEKDETGFPRIRETTVLSAVDATGQVEPGDYIVGIVNPDGETISFQNLSVREVVKQLRGKPGSEVQLLMERVSPDGYGDSHTFDVSIQRSLLVIQPPY